MAKGPIPSRLKGYKRTYTVHSETNPYAAVAAMAILMNRIRERGRFFRFSEALIPSAPRNDAPENPPASAPNDLMVDFTSDWAKYLYQHALPACGVKAREGSLEDDTLRYLNADGRRIPVPKPRTVHESRELSVAKDYQHDYESLKTLISSGGDLRPYLSRDILKKKCPDKNDGLLNAWGIQHLHFKATGTKHLLFCRITESDVFMIQTLPHEGHVWVDTDLLQILHNNWPEELALERLQGLIPEVFPTDKRHALRGLNANFITTMTDGTVYLAPGGGQMASGDSPDDLAMCDSIFIELKQLQEHVTANAASIRSALNWLQDERMSIKMMFDHRDYCMYEPTTRMRIKLCFPNDISD